MDCDDQIRLVKRNHNPHPLAPNVPDIPPISVRVQIDIFRIRNQLFNIGDSRTNTTSPILCMPRKAHIGLRACRS